jgi:hypothetical protein
MVAPESSSPCTDPKHVAAAGLLSQHIVRAQLIRIVAPLQSED